MIRSIEPCLCGDPECPRCFYQSKPDADPDEAYEILRQKEIDMKGMAGSMTINEAEILKRKLEDGITIGLAEFERETGQVVTYILLNREVLVNAESVSPMNVKLIVWSV